MNANIIGGPHDGSTVAIDIHTVILTVESLVVDRLPDRNTRESRQSARYHLRADGNFHFVGYGSPK